MGDEWNRKIVTGNIKTVTAGLGGEAFLIFGDEKVALYDTGMACFGEGLLENIRCELKGRSLDYVLVSHIHYDHVGALPYVISSYPSAQVLTGEHGEKLVLPFKYELVRELSNAAAKDFLGENATIPPYDDSVWKVDRVLKDGDTVSLGGVTLRTIATPGHTKDCIAFYIPEWDLLLASETTGVWESSGKVVVPFLTGYKDSMKAIKRCRALNAKHLFSEHSLEISPKDVPKYWERGIDFAGDYKKILLDLLRDSSLTDEERVDRLAAIYWTGQTKTEQPRAAFDANTYAQLKLFRKEFPDEIERGERIIETERLFLREMNTGDFAALKAVIGDAENMRYYPAPYDDVGVRKWIRWCVLSYATDAFGLWAVCRKDTDEMIGDCGISMQMIDGEELPEIGFHIRKDMHGKGFAKEAASAVLSWGFRNTSHEAFYSYCEQANEPSYKTAESVGMKFLKEYTDAEGERLRVSVIKREDWKRTE